MLLLIVLLLTTGGSVALSKEVYTGSLQELFGDDLVQPSKQQVSSHLSQSVEDIAVLMQKEMTAIQLLHQLSSLPDLKGTALAKTAVKGAAISADFAPEHNHGTAFAEEQTDLVTLASHPVRAYKVIWRWTRHWPKVATNIRIAGQKLSQKIRNKKAVKQMIKQLSDHLVSAEVNVDSDLQNGAIFGLLQIQRHNSLNTSDLVNGLVIDSSTSKQFPSNCKISSEEALFISWTALKLKWLDYRALWLAQAVKSGEIESKDEKYMKDLRKLLAEAEQKHDEHILVKGFFDPLTDRHVRLSETPFNKDLENSEQFQQQVQVLRDVRQNCPMFQDFLDERQMTRSQNNSGSVVGELLRGNMELRYRTMEEAQNANRYKLCQGDRSMRPPSLDASLSCSLLHYFDPYLVLGPFKYEVLNSEPFTALFHGMFFKAEMEQIKEFSRGKMKATPLVVGGKLEQYTQRRTSKTISLLDHVSPTLSAFTNRISLATKMKLNQRRFDSENYQVMNYGLGGAIRMHKDSFGTNTEDLFKDNCTSSECYVTGGPRLMTWMIYMSEVEAGGRTVFTTSGLSVPPQEGSALMWLNLRSDGATDSRVYHCGCPVLVGNKWINNKWVKWTGQMWQFPCHRHKGTPYHPFNNQDAIFYK